MDTNFDGSKKHSKNPKKKKHFIMFTPIILSFNIQICKLRFPCFPTILGFDCIKCVRKNDCAKYVFKELLNETTKYCSSKKLR